MISAFLKKLLFARQFYMMDGRIEVLGTKQIMLPFDILPELQNSNPKKVYSNVKGKISEDIEDYGKKLGARREGILVDIKDIFETFGLGKIEIIYLKKEKSVVRVSNSPVYVLKNSKSNTIIPALLAGIFSYLFNKDVDCEAVKTTGINYQEFVIK